MFTPTEKRMSLLNPIRVVKSYIGGIAEGVRLGLFVSNLPGHSREDRQAALKTVRGTQYHWYATLPDGAEVIRCRRDCPLPTNNRKYYLIPNN